MAVLRDFGEALAASCQRRQDQGRRGKYYRRQGFTGRATDRASVRDVEFLRVELHVLPISVESIATSTLNAYLVVR